MKHKLNRLTAIVLSFILLLSACPLSALAAILSVPSTNEMGLPIAHTYEFYNKGEEYAKYQVINGSVLCAPPTPGVGFICWEDQDGNRFNGFGIQSSIKEIQTIKLYARFEDPSATKHRVKLIVKVLRNNGRYEECTYRDFQVNLGEEVTLPDDFTWTAANGESPSSPMTITEDTTLYAEKAETDDDTINVTYRRGGSGYADYMDGALINEAYYRGGAIILKELPTGWTGPEGRTRFIGWSIKDLDDQRFYQPGASISLDHKGYPYDLTIVAQWSTERNETTTTKVVYHQNRGFGEDKTYGVDGVPVNANYTLLEIGKTGLSIGDNASFKGWSTTPSEYANPIGSEAVYIDAEGENHLYALWKKAYVSINIYAEDAKGWMEFQDKYYRRLETVDHKAVVGDKLQLSEVENSYSKYLVAYQLNQYTLSSVKVVPDDAAELDVYLDKKPFTFQVRYILQDNTSGYDFRNPVYIETFENVRVGDRVNLTYNPGSGYEVQNRYSSDAGGFIINDEGQLYVEEAAVDLLCQKMMTIKGLKHWVGDNPDKHQPGTAAYQKLNLEERPIPDLQVLQEDFWGSQELDPEINWNKNYAADTWEYSFVVPMYAVIMPVRRMGAGGGGPGSDVLPASATPAKYTVREKECRGYVLIRSVENASGGSDFTNKKLTDGCKLAVDKELEAVLPVMFDSPPTPERDEPILRDVIRPTGRHYFTQEGESLIYVVRVRNEGSEPLTEITIIDSLVEIGYENFVYGTDKNNDQILSPGEEWIYQYRTSVTEEQMEAGVVVNTVTVVSDQTDEVEDTVWVYGGKVQALTVQPKEVSKTYDGKELTPADVVVTGLPKGYTVETVLSGSQTNAG